MDWEYVAGAVIALVLVAGLIAWADRNISTTAGVKKGEAIKQAEWDKQKEKDRIAAAARDKRVSDAIIERESARLAAVASATDSNAKFQEKVREARRLQVELASRVPAAPEAGVTASTVVNAPSVPAPGLRVHWRLVGLLDGAFTGTDGKPLFKAQSEFALDPARADTPSQFGLLEVVDVAGANAAAFSSCRRDYEALMGRINRAEAAWNNAKPK